MQKRVWAGCVAAVVAVTGPALATAQPADREPELAELRLAVSLDDRTLFVIAAGDTIRRAPVAVASNGLLTYAGRTWRFTTPRGRHVVRDKRADPMWRPPDWHYAETARDHGLALRHLPATGLRLPDGRRLVIRDSLVGVQDAPGGDIAFLPLDEHIVFGNTLYIPPLGTRNRELPGTLGRFALDLGRGYLLHGTPDQSSIGTATTHGCIRLGDEDIAWLFEHVPVGTAVDVH